jgi:tRNA(fMet)-specific endonuclease VapC
VGVILDTSVLIAAERGHFDFERFVLEEDIDDARIAAITASELLQGVLRARPGPARARRSQFVESVLGQFPAEPFTVETARIHARIWAAAGKRGRMIGAHDLIIAATALEQGLAVATLNDRDFREVTGLALAPAQSYLQRAGA